MRNLYQGSSTIAGRLQSKSKVSFKASLSQNEKTVLFMFMLLIASASAGLAWTVSAAIISSGFSLAFFIAMALVLLVEVLRILQSATLLVFAYFAKDPVPMVPDINLRIAVLTTIVPGKEPFDLVAKTLREMKKIDGGTGNQVDVWLLDEGNDHYIKDQCMIMGVHHFSRKGVKKWNTESGAFKARTKHGNHNAWRDAHENMYHIVAQMDPDHVPRKNFLMRTLGYFRDPDVGFVVAPQVYGNLKDNWIARASACQAYIFHGIIQRGGNGMQAPLLIGTNHLYRTKAFRQIDGYQDSIIEDHLTSLVLSGAKNSTGNTWKGIYTPDILAVGEGPTSFTDYFNQQKRWAYGIWDIARKYSPGALKKLTKLQALTFILLQYFYPSLAISWLLSSIVTILFGTMAMEYDGLGAAFAFFWVYSIASSLALFFWLRRFNLVEHERKDWCVKAMGLTIISLPVYFNAAWEAILRKPLSYAVTAKGNLSSPDNLNTFGPHLVWLALNLTILSFVLGVTNVTSGSNLFWIGTHIAICILPMGIYAAALLNAIRIHPALPSLGQVRKFGSLRFISLTK